MFNKEKEVPHESPEQMLGEAQDYINKLNELVMSDKSAPEEAKTLLKDVVDKLTKFSSLMGESPDAEVKIVKISSDMKPDMMGGNKNAKQMML